MFEALRMGSRKLKILILVRAPLKQSVWHEMSQNDLLALASPVLFALMSRHYLTAGHDENFYICSMRQQKMCCNGLQKHYQQCRKLKLSASNE